MQLLWSFALAHQLLLLGVSYLGTSLLNALAMARGFRTDIFFLRKIYADLSYIKSLTVKFGASGK